MTKKPTKKVAVKAPKAPRKPAIKQTQVYIALDKAIKDLSPQAIAIVEAVKASHGRTTRAELLKLLEKSLSTDQSASRVLSYYKKPLIDERYIKVEKVDVAVPAKAKAEKAPQPEADEPAAEAVPVMPAPVVASVATSVAPSAPSTN